MQAMLIGQITSSAGYFKSRDKLSRQIVKKIANQIND